MIGLRKTPAVDQQLLSLCAVLTVSLKVSRALTVNSSFVFPHLWQDVVQGPPEALRKVDGHSRLSVAVLFPKPGAGGRTRNTATREK